MPGITIQAGWGAGGSVVAPAVAQALDLPLLDRAISATVAELLQVTVQEAEAGETKRTFTDRFLSALLPLSGGVFGAGFDAVPLDSELQLDDSLKFRDQAETIMRDALVSGAVILGRAGSAALRNEPKVLRVRLFGSVAARVAHMVEYSKIDPKEARERLRHVDDARDHYIWRMYKVRADDPTLFQLQIDSTLLSLDACTTIIVDAYRALIA
jgi:cytidylate kinase